jgi:hypothetical protein
MDRIYSQTRDLDGWEKLVIEVALDALFRKWKKNPDEFGVAPSALVNLAKLKLDLLTTRTIRIES